MMGLQYLVQSAVVLGGFVHLHGVVDEVVEEDDASHAPWLERSFRDVFAVPGEEPQDLAVFRKPAGRAGWVGFGLGFCWPLVGCVLNVGVLLDDGEQWGLGGKAGFEKLEGLGSVPHLAFAWRLWRFDVGYALRWVSSGCMSVVVRQHGQHRASFHIQVAPRSQATAVLARAT